MNDRIYIHEIIHISGLHRANYMHHMTANWSPTAQEDRNQLCYGVWAAVGSTGRWPEVVNLWEMEGWEGLAAGFGHETQGRGGYDPVLEKWWAKAAEFRRGGLDRIVEPAPWTRTITELLDDGVRGECYVHDLVSVRPGSDREMLERVREDYAPLAEVHGWQLTGAFRTTMRNDDEAILLWTVPTFQSWAAFEREHGHDTAAGDWRRDATELARSWERALLVDAPLSPFRTGRQPRREDRTDWVD